MKKICLDDLPRYSPWPERLLDEPSPATTYPGAREKLRRQHVVREYEEKYGALLEFYEQRPLTTYEDLRSIELDDRREVAMSIKDQLYAVELEEAMECSVDAMLKYLRAEALLAGSVVDLGCGYGYLLHKLGKSVHGKVRMRGGELTQAGTLLAQRLGTFVTRCDFLREEPCAVLETLQERSVITTSYAMHQLPTAEYAVELLSRYREKVSTVVCLEPEEDLFGDGLLGLLRRRYGKFCGYSADLLRVLKSRRDVNIEFVEKNAIGANALLPGTISVWSFR